MMSLALELGSNAGWMTEMPWGQGPPAPSAATKQIIKKPQWQTFWTTAPVILNVILSDVAVLFLMQKRRVISSATLSAPIALVSCTVRRLHWQWQEPGGPELSGGIHTPRVQAPSSWFPAELLKPQHSQCFSERGGLGSSPCRGTDGSYGHAPLRCGESLAEGWSVM